MGPNVLDVAGAVAGQVGTIENSVNDAMSTQNIGKTMHTLSGVNSPPPAPPPSMKEHWEYD